MAGRGDSVTVGFTSSANDISSLHQRIEDVVNELYTEEIMHPTFNDNGEAVMHRAPRFDTSRLALSIFPPSSGCSGAQEARGTFPVVAARARRQSAQQSQEESLKYATILHPLHPIGKRVTCNSGSYHLDDTTRATRHNSTTSVEINAGSYVFTGVVVKARSTSAAGIVMRDPFCRVTYSDPDGNSSFLHDVVARDASVPPRTFGIADKSDNSCAGGFNVKHTTSSIGEYIQCKANARN